MYDSLQQYLQEANGEHRQQKLFLALWHVERIDHANRQKSSRTVGQNV